MAIKDIENGFLRKTLAIICGIVVLPPVFVAFVLVDVIDYTKREVQIFKSVFLRAWHGKPNPSTKRTAEAAESKGD